jgi:hypothetical protein
MFKVLTTVSQGSKSYSVTDVTGAVIESFASFAEAASLAAAFNKIQGTEILAD